MTHRYKNTALHQGTFGDRAAPQIRFKQHAYDAARWRFGLTEREAYKKAQGAITNGTLRRSWPKPRHKGLAWHQRFRVIGGQVMWIVELDATGWLVVTAAPRYWRRRDGGSFDWQRQRARNETRRMERKAAG